MDMHYEGDGVMYFLKDKPTETYYVVSKKHNKHSISLNRMLVYRDVYVMDGHMDMEYGL